MTDLVSASPDYSAIDRDIVALLGSARRVNALIKRLSADLSTRFCRGSYERNLEQMRSYYRAWHVEQISQTASAKLPPSKKSQPLSENSVGASEAHYALEGLLDGKLLAEKPEKTRWELQITHSGLTGDMEGGE